MDHTIYPFALKAEELRASAPSLNSHMTLRNACIDYRDAGGIAWDNASPPELSRATSTDQISCLNKFSNIVGMPVGNDAILFDLEEIDNISGMFECVTDLLNETISDGVLWCIRRTSRYHTSEKKWKKNDCNVSSTHNEILRTISSCDFNPISACTAHAAVEADKFGSDVGYNDIFTFPHNATPSLGLIGTLGDNQAIDMVPQEKDDIPDQALRQWHESYVGIICALHTSHSGEAGRVRKVASDVRVRVLSQNTISCLTSLRDSVCNEEPVNARWLVFMMGKYTYVDYRVVRDICSHHACTSMADICAYSLYINSEHRVVVINCSSGVLIKLTSNGFHSDSTEIHESHRPFGYKRSFIDTSGVDSKRACFSAYALLADYLEFNRAPRPSIASVQLPQAVCLPWAVGTAAVSPCYIFDPITTTPLYKAVMKDQREDTANLATYMPGENVGVLYLNLEGNYEDAIFVSQRYIDNGGFLSMSICAYIVSQSEYVPPIGYKVCGVVCEWWKSRCDPTCKHTKEWMAKRVYKADGRCTSATIHSVSRTDNGEWSVKVRSFEQLQQGDKLSTKHGQKGIAVVGVMGPEDLPIVVTGKGYNMIPDVVVAMSSVVTRQTNGQLYETAHALSLLKNNVQLPVSCEPGKTFDTFENFNVLRSSDGTPYTTLTTASDGTQVRHATMVTFGYIRMFSQTQKSRERHQISHLAPGPGTLRTVSGRSRGGAVAYSEMDVQASVAAGLRYCGMEITSRGSMIVVPVCPSCQRLWLLCKRTEDCLPHINTEIPFDQVVHTVVVKIVYNIDIEYNVEMGA